MVRSNFSLACLTAIWLAGTQAAAQTVTAQLTGDVSAGRFAFAVDTLPDLDGDGADELIVGAPLAGGGGSVRVLAIDGSEWWQVLGAAGERLGHAVAVLGDLDADGVNEVAVGAPFAVDANGQVRGRVTVHSGLDGTVIHTVTGTFGSDELGTAVAALGDIDGDGVDDFAAGAPGTAGQRGYVRAYSGATGLFRFTRFGQISTERFGQALTGVVDVNGDMVPDLAVGGPFVAGSNFAGFVRLVSGANGAVLWSASGDAPQDGFGTALDAGLDVDGDGVSEIVAGAPQSGVASGFVRVLSGGSGTALATFVGIEPGARFGHAVRIIADVDGDGAGDLAIGSPAADSAAIDGGEVGLYDLAGTLLGQLAGMQAQEEFGHAIVSGVGLSGLVGVDLVIGAPGFSVTGPDDGAAYVASTASAPTGPTMTANVTTVSLAAGEKQTLTIDAGAGFAGQRFVVLGSASGTDPGFVVGGFTVPLVPDPYLWMTIFGRTSLLRPARGLLDANGQATVEFTPVGRCGRRLRRAWAGKTLYHAAILIDGRLVTGVTGAVAVTIVP